MYGSAPVAASAATVYENQYYGVRDVSNNFTQRTNTK
jgi:hypothetical protein